MKNIPEKIYIQVESDDGDIPEEDFKDIPFVTWCEDKINDTDLEYRLVKKERELPEHWTTP